MREVEHDPVRVQRVRGAYGGYGLTVSHLERQIADQRVEQPAHRGVVVDDQQNRVGGHRGLARGGAFTKKATGTDRPGGRSVPIGVIRRRAQRTVTLPLAMVCRSVIQPAQLVLNQSLLLPSITWMATLSAVPASVIQASKVRFDATATGAAPVTSTIDALAPKTAVLALSSRASSENCEVRSS